MVVTNNKDLSVVTTGAIGAVLALTIPGLAYTFFNRTVEGIRDLTKIEILKGVGLPSNIKNMPFGKRFTNLVQGSIRTNLDVVSFVSQIGSDFFKRQRAWIESNDGKKDLRKNIPIDERRTDPLLLSLFSEAIASVIKQKPNDADPAEGYLYFGNRDFKKILTMLCSVNPFFASALTVSEDKNHFELIAFSNREDFIRDPPLYLSLMRELKAAGTTHRINAKFNKAMELVEISMYDNEREKMIPVEESEWDYYASGILYNLLFYASTIHATIHMLHYLMCAGIVMSTRGTNKTMEKWADIYDDNIAIKYVEVAGLLYHSEFLGKGFSLQGFEECKKLVSGEDGFGASEDMMPKVKHLLELFGSIQNTDEFLKKFLHSGIYSTVDAADDATVKAMINDSNILTQFHKFAKLVPDFAKELTGKMKAHDSNAFKKTEKKLKSFMEDCGPDVSSIKTVSSWIELMCMTGIVHGSTLSYTRLFIIPEVMRWRKIEDPIWNEDDFQLMNGGAGTMVGMTEDRHVFTSSIKHGYRWETQSISDDVLKVLTKYDLEAQNIKDDYTNEIKKEKDFCEYGWILTDFCADGFDGKQQTITTYI